MADFGDPHHDDDLAKAIIDANTAIDNLTRTISHWELNLHCLCWDPVSISQEFSEVRTGLDVLREILQGTASGETPDKSNVGCSLLCDSDIHSWRSHLYARVIH